MQKLTKELSQDERSFLARTIRRTVYSAGSAIFHQGDAPEGIHYLESGAVLLDQTDAAGNLTGFRLVFAREFLGYRAYFSNDIHAATARVVQTAAAILIPGESIERLLNTNARCVGRFFLNVLAHDPGPMLAQLIRNPYLPARTRLVHFLLYLAEQPGATPDENNSVSLRLPLKRSDIAAMLGLRIETVSRLIRELRIERRALFEKGKVMVPNLEQLRRELDAGI